MKITHYINFHDIPIDDGHRYTYDVEHLSRKIWQYLFIQYVDIVDDIYNIQDILIDYDMLKDSLDTVSNKIILYWYCQKSGATYIFAEGD